MELIDQARSGNEQAFAQLVDPYRRELEVHCYRMLGSAADAEDALQETLLAAWRGLGEFEERASIRTWLYRIATNRSLNMLRSTQRRPAEPLQVPGVEPPEPSQLAQVVWLEPYPDVLLDELLDATPGPDVRYEARETVSLAFVTALQLLAPRQRAVLILRDVLGFSAKEVAAMIDTTEQSVASALKRARAALSRQLPSAEAPPPPRSAAEQAIVDRFVDAYEAADVDGIIALMTDDAWLRMPPVPLEYRGRELVAQFLTVVGFRQGRRFRLVATRANGQPVFGAYLRDPVTGIFHASGMVAVALAGNQMSAITRFDNTVLGRCGLPRTLPG